MTLMDTVCVQIQGAASPLFVTLALQWLPGAVYDSLVSWPRLGPRCSSHIGELCPTLCMLCWSAVQVVHAPGLQVLPPWHCS